ncbi:MAG TPA: T9SS C-terminal target domain-containing protein, partial [bacterium]|nr:T9SS C-terminal target domain-containing protein [bacterium]
MKMRLITVTLIFLVTLAAAVHGAPSYCGRVLGPGLNSGRTPFHQNYNLTLSADTLYYLTGLYYVDSTYTITIPAGTVVMGDTAATLVIMRGAQIFANGTVDNPIIFTSMKPAGQRQRGDWGGVIILGQAPVNQYEPLIEGGIIGGTYGGTNPHDNAGIFRYVRIEFPGYRFQLNNEINGLTMGGVGDGTQIDHVQVSYSFDDSYEWFGGTVNCKYLVAFGGT